MQCFIKSASTSYSFKPDLQLFIILTCALAEIFAACLISDTSLLDLILLISNMRLDKSILVDLEVLFFKYLD